MPAAVEDHDGRAGLGWLAFQVGVSPAAEYPWPVFSPQGPSVRELAMQALSSVEGGYDLLAADVRALPFAGAFDLAVSFGALGHFLPAERPVLFAGVYRALRPGGLFAFPVAAPQPVTSSWYWALLGFDVAMRVRNAVWRPPFVMYYRTCPLHAVRNDLTACGFTVTTVPLTALGRREDGSPRFRLLLARKPARSD
jgi:SAM-dependent methyltransferase